jgi:hypothetical protein
MTGRFKGLQDKPNPAALAVETPMEPSQTESRAVRNPRAGKKAVVGYFSPAVNKGLRQLALDIDSTTQALLGEAIDLLMRKYDRHPFGER